jgi:hypothetical protein
MSSGDKGTSLWTAYVVRRSVCFWHFSDITFVLRDVRSRGQSGKHLLALSFSAFDFEADLAPMLPEAGAGSKINS